jgi:type II secretory pathway pseudopilin PulG
MIFDVGSTVKAIAALLIVAIIAGGAWYVTGLRADLAVSRANAEKLQDGIRAQQELITQIRRDVAKIQNINSELQQENQRQQAEIRALSDRFNVNARGEARDFGAIAAARPGSVERLVNRGSDNARRCLEIASGSPLTEQEKNAKTSSEINRECPTLANPLYRSIAP